MPQESIHQEIKWLENQLEAKKQELLKTGETKEEKEVLKDIIKEAHAEPQNLPTQTLSDDDAQKAAYELKEKEHAQIVEDLVNIALVKGLYAAVKVANSLRNPHILDEFHDTLTDKYYKKLLDSRKLK